MAISILASFWFQLQPNSNPPIPNPISFLPDPDPIKRTRLDPILKSWSLIVLINGPRLPFPFLT